MIYDPHLVRLFSQVAEEQGLAPVAVQDMYDGCTRGFIAALKNRQAIMIQNIGRIFFSPMITLKRLFWWQTQLERKKITEDEYREKITEIWPYHEAGREHAPRKGKIYLKHLKYGGKRDYQEGTAPGMGEVQEGHEQPSEGTGDGTPVVRTRVDH